MDGKQEKRKKMGMKIVAGAGGGLAGIILLGGALATTALVSTFVIKRRQHSNSNSKSTHNQKTNQIDHLLNKSKLKDDHVLGSEGLSFLVPDSSSPINHHPSNGTADTQNELGSTQILILDETLKNEINGGKDKEILLSDLPKKSGNNLLCDESCISTVEFSFPVFDSSYGKVNKKNESLEEVEAKKVDEEVKAAHSNRVFLDDNRKIPSNIQEEDEDVCDGNGEIIVGKSEDLVEAAHVDQLLVDENPHKPWEECDDDGERTVDKCKELVEEVHATDGIQLREEQEATMDGDEETICFDSSMTVRNEAETYDVNKAEILLSVIDSLSLPKPGNDDSAEVPLIIESMQVMKGDEPIEAVEGDQTTLEDRPQTQLIGAEEQEEESYKVDREITNGKCEESDQIAVQDENQQMQLSEYQDTPINGDQEQFISDKLSPESNSFLVYGVKVQEFSLPSLDGPLLSESGNLNEENSAEAALHVEVVKPMEEDETAEVVLYDQIIVENHPPMQSSEKGQLENCSYCSENVVAKGEEAVETVDEDIVKVFNNSEDEEEDDDGNHVGSKNVDEAIETVDEDIVKVFNNSEDEEEDDDGNHVGSKNVDEAVETVHEDVVDKNPQTQLSEEDDDVNNGASENGKEVVETVDEDIVKVFNNPKTQVNEDDDGNHVGSKNVDEAVETVRVDVGVDKNPQTQLSEEDDDTNNGSSENGKEVDETVRTDIFEVENKLQTLLSEEESDGEEDDEESDGEEDDEESDGEEDDEESNGEEDDGKVEESSETTGDSSLESNAEAIWPAESVKELSLKLKELQANDQNLEATNEDDMTVNTKHNCQNSHVQSNDHNIKESEGKGKFVRASTQTFATETSALKQPINFFNLKIWILSSLVLLLLVLWLHAAK